MKAVRFLITCNRAVYRGTIIIIKKNKNGNIIGYQIDVTKQAETLLGALSHDTLKAFIHEACMNDRKFCQLFVAKHIHLLYPESKELYSRQLQTLINVYSDKDGFVSYRDASRLGSIVSEMAVEAMADLEEGKIRKSLFIAWAIIEEMVIMVTYKADDSDGQIGGSIEEAFAVLEALTEINLDKRLHDALFDCMLSLFENNSLKDWDWHFTSMYLAIKLVKTNQEKEKIKSALDKIKPNGKSWNWDYEKAQGLMLELIKKTESPGLLRGL